MKGSGVIVSEQRALPAFNSITSAIPAEIFLTQGPKSDIIIEAQQNVLNELKTRVVNDELIMDFDHCVDLDQKINIYIVIPEIKKLVLTGVGNIIAQNEFQLADLNIIITGVGDCNLKGSSDKLTVLLSGVGNVKAFELVSGICDVSITGVGNMELFVTDQLDVTITGSGTVFYKGNPMINSTISGNGKIVNAN